MSVVPFRGQDPGVNAALEARQAARLQIVRTLESQQDSEESKVSRHLIAAIEAMDPKDKVSDAYVTGLTLVEKRIEAMRARGKTLKAYQYRNAKIILVYGAGKLPRDLLERVCAILKLHGPKGSTDFICQAFPGFVGVFDK